jgi:hypothetical protein
VGRKVFIETVRWGANWYHATRRASREEIEEVFANSPRVVRNLRGRTADWLAIGATDAGRSLTVAFIYDAQAHEAWPITAWENR